MEAHGWQRFANGHWSHFPLPFPLRDPSKLHILSSIEDSKHRFWYKLPETPNVYYCVDGGVLTRYAGIDTEDFVPSEWPGRTSYSAIYEDWDGTIWTGRWNGLSKLAGSHLIAEPASSEIQGRINAILRDRAGDLWVGGEKGLYRIQGGHCTQLGRVDGLASDSPYVQTIFEDRTACIFCTGLTNQKGRFIAP